MFYSQCGENYYLQTWKNFKFSIMVKEAKDLPVKKYDLCITDFDHITARACKNKKMLQLILFKKKKNKTKGYKLNTIR